MTVTPGRHDLGASVLLSRRDFVMRHHHVHDTSVMPGATFLDLIWRVARLRGLDGALEIADVIFEEPVVTDHESDRRIRLAITRGDSGFDVCVTSVPVRDDGAGGGERRHMTGVLRQVPAPPATAAVPSTGNGARQRDMAELYAQARSEHIEHGAPMRAFGHLVDAGDGLLATIALAGDHPAPDGFHLHPALLDASTLIAFARTPKLEHPYIPITIGRVTLVQPLTSPACQVWVPATEVHAVSGDIMHNSYDILGSDGTLAARIERLACKRIRHAHQISGLTTSRAGSVPVAAPEVPVRAGESGLADRVREIVGAALGRPGRDINTDTGFYELGLDSVALLHLSERIGADLGRALYPTLLFEHSTVDELVAYLTDGSPSPPRALSWAAHWVSLPPSLDRSAGALGTLSVVAPDGALPAGLRAAIAAEGWRVQQYASVPDTPDPAVTWCLVASNASDAERYQELLRRLGRVAGSPCAALLLAIGDDPAPEVLGTGAYTRTVQHEVGALAASVLVATSDEGAAAIARSLTAVLCGRLTGLHRVRHGELQALDYRLASPSDDAISLLRPRGSYVVTGGGGGLGRILAEHLVGRYDATVHLLGRALTHERPHGGSITSTRCDVTDPDACVATIDALRREYGRIDGVFHLAGVIDDGIFLTGGSERTGAIVRPKLDGARNLWRALATDDLDFFVSFTSISGAVPNAGQSAYAYANSCVDFWSIGIGNGGTGCEVLAIAWPYWSDGGMRATAGTDASGLVDLPTSTGIEALTRWLRRTGQGHVCVTYGDPDRVTSAMVRHPDAPATPVTAVTPDRTPAAEPTIAPIVPNADAPIAIIGLAGSYPGAPDVAAFWEMLCAGTDAVTEITDGTWPEHLQFSGDRERRGTSYSRWGAFLTGADHFAPAHFGISRREAESMDPQERQFLMAAWRALEDAARPPESLRGETVGVFCGVMWNHYQLYRDADGVAPTALHSTIPNRVSYCFDFTGPSLAVDTACSGSLVAVHLAVQSLLRGESTVALAGGVNISTHPHKYVQLSADGFLSAHGRCRAFGEGADGYVPGEGVGVVVLKPLAKALADGDVIHAVIRGTRMNHNGRTAGFTVPDPAAQAALIGAAIAGAGVDPSDIGYLEAHGTGTSLGDPIEATAIARELTRHRPADRPLHVGSVKSNVGHLESAAGIAGLTKVVLQLEHGRIAPTLHTSQVNPAVREAAPALVFPQVPVPWPGTYPTRVAGLSAFGAGGTNVHAIVEAAPALPAHVHDPASAVAVLLCADTVALLQIFAADLRRWLAGRRDAGAGHRDVLARAAEALAVPAGEIDVDWSLRDLGFDLATAEHLVGGGGRPLREADLSSLTLRGLMAPASGGTVLADLAYTLRVGRRPRAARLAITCTTVAELDAALAAYARGEADGAHHRSAVVRGTGDSVDAVEVSNDADRVARAWCAAAVIAEPPPGAGRRISLPVAPLPTEPCRLGGWQERQRRNIDEGHHAMSTQRASGHSFTVLPDGIGLLRLDSPETHNMMTDELLSLLGDALRRVAADDAIRVLVITGNGEDFCLGGTPEAVHDVAAQRTTFGAAAVVYEGLTACPKPVVTALNGNASGGGLAFGLYGDLVILSRDAFYSANFLRHGITPGMGATLIVEQRFGGPLSAEMLMTGREYAGRELERRGALVGFHDGDRVLAEAMSLARSVAAQPPEAVRALKAHLSAPTRQQLPQTVAAEMAMHRQLATVAVAPPPPERIDEPAPEVPARVIDTMLASLAEILFAEPGEVDRNLPFNDQGLDSVGAVQLVRDLNTALHTDLESTVVYQYPTVEALAAHLTREIGAVERLTASARTVPHPDVSVLPERATEPAAALDPQPGVDAGAALDAVAVVGMAGRWPDADDVEQFARNIAAGRSSIRDVTHGRWDLSGVYSPQRARGKSYSRWAALLADIESFDYGFFNLSPADADGMDCQQRLFLTEAWNALRDAGHEADPARRGRTGVYVGCAPGDHGERLRAQGAHETAQAFLGSSASILAARISYFLDLAGPAIAVDTACSSSLVAVHLACQALRSGEIDTALAGGVAVMETPSLQVRSAQVGMLSPTGTSAPFDASADGIVLGEAVGVVVLRRLADARRDGDRVLAIIRGTGVNGDGRTNGITAPNADAQARLMTDTLRGAGVAADGVSFVESHGTGTRLGDPIEVRGLTTALGSGQPAWLSSVKANIGHTTTAAGVSSLIKAILCMQMQVAPRVPRHRTTNPEIGSLGRLRLPTSRQPWSYQADAPRFATVSSFGFSGTNAIAVLQDTRPSLPWAGSASRAALAEDADGGSWPVRANDPIVADHIVDGQPLLPAAATVELTRAALAPDRPFTLRDVRWRAPLAVDGDTSVTVHAAPEQPLTIGSVAVPGAVTATLAEAPPDPGDRLDLDALRARCGSTVGGADLYASFAEAGLAYGPRYRRLRQVLVGDGLVVGELTAAPAGFGAQTAMLDAAFQTLGALPDVGDDAALVPVAASGVHVWGDGSSATIAVGERTGTTYRVTLATASGAPVVRVDGLRLYPVRLDKPLAASTDGMVFGLSWEPVAWGEPVAPAGPLLVVAAASRDALSATLLSGGAAAASMLPIERPQDAPVRLLADARSIVLLPDAGVDRDASAVVAMLRQLTAWCRALHTAVANRPLTLIFVTERGVGVDADEVPHPVHSAVHGFAAAVAAEHPAWSVRCVDIGGPADHDTVSGAARCPVGCDAPHRVLALRGGVMLRRVFRPLPAAAARLDLGRRAIIIGATGMLGRTIAAAHAATTGGAGTQVWIGRRPETAVAHHISAVAGASVHYLQADAADPAAVARALAAAERVLGGVDVVVHCAGELRDRELVHLTDRDVTAVVAPRVDGLRHVLAYPFTGTAPRIVVCSSAVAFVDARGQANYAAACCALDATALAANRVEGREVTVVDWGYWDGDGVASTPYHRSLMAADGILPLAPAQAMAALAGVLAGGWKQALVIKSTVDGLAHFGVAQPALAPAGPITPAVAVAPAVTVAAARQYARDVFCEVLGFRADELSLDASLDAYGIDSVVGVQILERLSRDLGDLPATLLYEERTLRALADRLHADHGDRIGAATAPVAVPASAAHPPDVTGRDDIAVIGLAGRYPGAPDLATFWANLRDGVCSLTEVPSERWDWRDFPDPRRGLQPYQAFGGFLADPYRFDAGLFGVLPKVAQDIDPQERLFLETAWDLLEQAGQLGDGARERSTGVFVGVMYGSYGEVGARLAEQGTPNGAHSAYWSIANRVSYTFDLSGPSMAVDSACSSSLTAVHLAVQALRNGECDTAIAGGVNLVLHPSHMIALGERNMLASDGRVKVFDAGADGYVPGEGAGAVLLKPLRAAVRDGDEVWAVIRGSATNAGGHTSGFTVPNPRAQARVVASAIRDAGVAPESLTYIEAHGSGTALGDPIEIAALGTAFADLAGAPAPRWIGSVKSNIGHLEGAAGIAGLTKAVLQLRHRRIAPTVNLETVNPRIPFTATELRPAREAIAWAGAMLRAGVSSFGAGGANAHVVLEQAAPRPAPVPTDPPHLVLLSCPDLDRLREYATEVAEFAASGASVLDPLALARLAWTSQTGRPSLEYRLAVLCSTGRELARRLRAFAADHEAGPDFWSGRGIFLGTPATRSARVEDGDHDEPLRRRDLDELASRWCAGARIAWSRLWPSPPGVVAYPGVPLRRRHYAVPSPLRPVIAADPPPQVAATHVQFEAPEWCDAPIGPARSGHTTLGIAAIGDAVGGLHAALRERAERHGIRAVDAGRAGRAPVVDALVLLVDPAADPVALAMWTIRTVLRCAPPDRARALPVLCAWPSPQAAPAGPALAGLLRTLAVEAPVTATTVDIGRMAAAAAAQILLDEVTRPDGGEVRYLDGDPARRQTVRMRSIRPAAPAPWTAAPGGYVVSGGGGKLGAATAGWLARVGAGTVWLLGRSPISPAVTALVDTFGPERIRFRQVDVTDESAVSRVLDEARAVSPLRGVVHAAGVLRDAPAARKTELDVAAVLRPKLTGLLVLDAATRADALDFFVAYSSLTARYGNPGQCDYAFANAYLDAYCAIREERRRAGQCSGRTLSVGWPLWAEGGMTVPAAVAESLRRRYGMVPMSSAAGFAALGALLRQEQHPVVHVVELEGAPREDEEPVRVEPKRIPVEEIAARVTVLAAEFLLVPAAEVDVDAELLELGFDSISLTELIERVNAEFGTDLRPTIAFENPTLRHLAVHLANVATPAPEAVPMAATAATVTGDGAIAIVGMASTIAGTTTPAQLWEALSAGTDLVRPIPPDRHELLGVAGADTLRGGFVDSAAAFDAEFFGIAPREARVMDPQQRLFLTVCWQALWDAGREPQDLRGTATGVFAGVSTMDYQDLMSSSAVPDEAHTATGLSHAVLANRVSHMLDLRGPSEAVDTACSSSLVALHRAVRALRSGECDQALVGGVNLTLTPGLFTAFREAGMLSPLGRCATFDAGADGYVRGEGAGAVLLKPLRDALRDGDRVHAVIRGTAVNHTGQTASLTAPSPRAQAEVLLAAHRDAGTDIRDVDYLEAHGTGTRLGDPVEVAGIRQALGSGATKQLVLGSVKASVGHLEAAAGMAGLVKAVLVLRHRTVPAQLHFHDLNPMIDLDGATLEIAAHTVRLPAEGTLLAGVSSFGFGGSNAHVVLSGPLSTGTTGVPADAARSAFVLPLAAGSEERLADYADALADGVCDRDPLESITATLQRRHHGGRGHGRARAVLICRDHADLRTAAKALSAGLPHERCLRTPAEVAACAPPAAEAIATWLGNESVDWGGLWAVQPTPMTIPAPPWRPRRHWFADPPPSTRTTPSPAAVVPAPSEPDSTPLTVLSIVRCEVAALLGMDSVDLDPTRTWAELGLDSIFAVDLAERLSAALGVDVAATSVVDAETVGGLAAHLAAAGEGAAPVEARLVHQLGLLLGQVGGQPVPAEADFGDAGLSSIDRLRAVGHLESHFGPLPNTLLYDEPTTVDLARFLARTYPDLARTMDGTDLAAVAELARVPGAGEVVRGPGGRLLRRADLPGQPSLRAAVEELSGRYRLESALAGRDIAAYLYVADDDAWYLDVAWSGAAAMVWGYVGPPERSIEALTAFGDLVTDAGARLSVLWPDPLRDVGGRRFESTAFGVMQEIDVDAFALGGGGVRRLRAATRRFADGGGQVEEYRVGSDPERDRQIVRLIDAWSATRANVNPYITTIRKEILDGALPPQQRVFLASRDGRLASAVVLSRLGAQNGYLLDVEFYGPDSPSGAVEFTVVHVLRLLRDEGVRILSLGATFAVPVGESPNPDPVLVAALDRMRDAGLTPLGNYHFKRKFRPAESPIFLCQPSGERTGLAEVMLLIGDPRVEPNVEPHGDRSRPGAEPAAAEAAGSHRDRLARADWNVLRLDRAGIALDLLTDSWAEHDGDVVRERMAALLRAPESSIGWLPFDTVVLAPSGRAAERILCRAWPGARGTVLHNGAFPTWLGALAQSRFTPRELSPIVDGDTVGALRRAVEQLAAAPSFVLIELCPNAAGGVPIRDAQLAEVRDLCTRLGTALVLDATRIIDNTLRPGLGAASLPDALRRTLAVADAVTMSLSKNFALASGGLVAASDGDLADALRSQAESGAGEFSVLGRRVMRAGLADLTTACEMVNQRRVAVTELARALRAAGVPVMPAEPTFAVCVPSGGLSESDALARAADLYATTGVRCGPHLASAVYPGLDGYLRLAVPMGYAALLSTQEKGLVSALARGHGGAAPALRGVESDERQPWFTRQLAQLRETFDAGLAEHPDAGGDNPNLRVLRRFCPAVRCVMVPDEGGVGGMGGIVEVFEAGGGERVPMVLMHPFNIGAGMFAHLMGALAPDRRVIVVHHPGVGRTRSSCELSLDGLVRLQMRVLEAVGVTGRFHLGGASVGSIFAQCVALAHPDRVASLSLLGGSYKFANRKGRIDKLEQVIADDFASIRSGGVELDHRLERAVTDLLVECESMDPRTGLRYLDLFARGSDLTDRLAEIAVPTLVVQGRHDSVVGVSTGQFIHRRIPRSRYLELARSGHFVCYTEPEAVHQAVAELTALHEAP